MVETVLRRSRRRDVSRMAVAAAEYAGMGWPVCMGAFPPHRPQRHGELPRACSCDRIGCPDPGAHPLSPAWQVQASADPEQVGRWWLARPDANGILVTGRIVDVLEVQGSARATA